MCSAQDICAISLSSHNNFPFLKLSHEQLNLHLFGNIFDKNKKISLELDVRV